MTAPIKETISLSSVLWTFAYFNIRVEQKSVWTELATLCLRFPHVPPQSYPENTPNPTPSPSPLRSSLHSGVLDAAFRATLRESRCALSLHARRQIDNQSRRPRLVMARSTFSR